MFYYRLYNLVLASPLETNLLPHAVGEKADVVICFKACPEYLTHKVVRENFFQAKDNNLLLVVAKLARFYMCDGNEIHIELFENADMNLLWTFILGSAIGAILIQRGYLVLHGNAVVDNDGRAVVFIADSGGGKSTLAAALQQSGYRILTDDVSAIYFDEKNQPWVLPAYGQLKLWRDSIDALDFSGEKMQLVHSGRDKYHVGSTSFQNKPAPLKAVYVLEEADKFVVKQLDNVRAFKMLGKHSYRFNYVKLLDLLSKHFQLCSLLLKSLSFYTISRPKNDPTNQLIVNWLKQESEAQLALL